MDVIAVSDESLRGMLKDERLQKEIIAIDTADDREEVVYCTALQSPTCLAFFILNSQCKVPTVMTTLNVCLFLMLLSLFSAIKGHCTAHAEDTHE